MCGMILNAAAAFYIRNDTFFRTGARSVDRAGRQQLQKKKKERKEKEKKRENTRTRREGFQVFFLRQDENYEIYDMRFTRRSFISFLHPCPPSLPTIRGNISREVEESEVSGW